MPTPMPASAPETYPPIEFSAAETGYQTVLADGLSPDLIFQRRWALNAVEKTLAATRKFHREQRLEAQVEALFTRQRDPEDKGPTSAALAEPIRDLPGKGPPDPPSNAPKLRRGTSFMKSAKPSGPTTPGKSGRNSAPCWDSSSRHDSQRCRSAGPGPACGYP